MPADNPFQIAPRRWYAWTMLPGYTGRFEPYNSPIKVSELTPLKTGKGVLRLRFFNAFYAPGVQDFEVELKVLVHEEHHLLGRLLYGKDSDVRRQAIIGEMSHSWLAGHFPGWFQRYPLDRYGNGVDLDTYLNRVFRLEKH